jgi:hypothetical protein
MGSTLDDFMCSMWADFKLYDLRWLIMSLIDHALTCNRRYVSELSVLFDCSSLLDSNLRIHRSEAYMHV